MVGRRDILTVRTERRFAVPAVKVWPLLCSSTMDRTSSLLFRLGVPQPLECRLPDGQGGVGSERECVSDQGVVHQRIVAWEPGTRLGFRMEKAEIARSKGVLGVEEQFTLRPRGRKLVVLRETTVALDPSFGFGRRLLLYLAFKQVHRYVFRNWQRLAAQDIASPPALD